MAAMDAAFEGLFTFADSAEPSSTFIASSDWQIAKARDAELGTATTTSVRPTSGLLYFGHARDSQWLVWYLSLAGLRASWQCRGLQLKIWFDFSGDVAAGPGGFSEYVLWRRPGSAKGIGFTLRGAPFVVSTVVIGSIHS